VNWQDHTSRASWSDFWKRTQRLSTDGEKGVFKRLTQLWNKGSALSIVKTIPAGILATVFAMLAIFSFLKGLSTEARPDQLLYYLVNYGHGFIRRGLLGELVSLAVDQSSIEHVRLIAFVLRVLASCAFVVGTAIWLYRLLATGHNPALLTCIFALFATSQLLPFLALSPDFLDIYDYLFVLLAALALTLDAVGIAALIGFVGPFVHEAFIFPWASLLVLELWRRRPPVKLALLLTPFLATAIIYFGATKQTAVAELAALPLTQEFKRYATEAMLGQTFVDNLKIMLWKHLAYPINVALAWAFFAAPAVLIVVLYTATRRRDLSVLITAILAPTAIFLVGGWEISRFTSATAFSALLAVFYIEAFKPTARVSSPWLAVGFLFAGFNLFVPSVLAYFERAAIVNRGPIPLVKTPVIAPALSDFVGYYNRYIAPADVAETAAGMPPGQTWYEQEDAWDSIWILRPGTNVFDSYACKGSMCGYGIQVVGRSGDRIVATRTGASDGNTLKLTGTIDGSKIQGTYPGGRWFATVSNERATEDDIRKLLREHAVSQLCPTADFCIKSDR
jgi:hypothetical protein